MCTKRIVFPRVREHAQSIIKNNSHIHIYIHTCNSVQLQPNYHLRSGKSTDTKTVMNKLEGAFHYFPDIFEQGNHNFRISPKVTRNYPFIYASSVFSLPQFLPVFIAPQVATNLSDVYVSTDYIMQKVQRV
jgi:hypothetical protein